MRRTWIALIIASVALAGCTGSETAQNHSSEVVDKETFSLAAGSGAIAGLLVDDRFRPIDLEDEPESEFQTTGFVLLQETGEQVQTNPDGEFTFVDLEPGTYTLRITADGHEAVPQRIQVAEGVFNEVSVVARRVLSEGSTIITNEYSVFIPCAADYLVNGGNLPCDLDLSDDGYASYFYSNLTGYADASFVVTELLANQDSGYHVQVRPGSGDQYAVAIWEGDYAKIVLEVGQTNTEWTDAAYGENGPFRNDQEFQTIFFVEHADLRQTIPGTCCGLGVTLGVKGQFLQSVFLGLPEVDIASYCGLC